MTNARSLKSGNNTNYETKKENTMNAVQKVVRRILATALFVVGLGIIGTKVEAANPDTMTVSVTPNVTFGVTITSVNASGYQFGTVNLGATTQSTAAVILTNSGNVAEYFSMAISNTSGGWSAVSGVP